MLTFPVNLEPLYKLPGFTQEPKKEKRRPRVWETGVWVAETQRTEGPGQRLRG